MSGSIQPDPTDKSEIAARLRQIAAALERQNEISLKEEQITKKTRARESRRIAMGMIARAAQALVSMPDEIFIRCSLGGP
jgi:hypothetical protein